MLKWDSNLEEFCLNLNVISMIFISPHIYAFTTRHHFCQTELVCDLGRSPRSKHNNSSLACARVCLHLHKRFSCLPDAGRSRLDGIEMSRCFNHCYFCASFHPGAKHAATCGNESKLHNRVPIISCCYYLYACAHTEPSGLSRGEWTTRYDNNGLPRR